MGETRPTRPIWLTILRASGVAASGVVGAVVGYFLVMAFFLFVVNLTPRLNWIEYGLPICLGLMSVTVSGGIIIGVRIALRLCRKYPQWTILGEPGRDS